MRLPARLPSRQNRTESDNLPAGLDQDVKYFKQPAFAVSYINSKGESIMSIRMKTDFECYIDGYTLIHIYMAKSYYGGVSQSFHLKDENGELLPLTILQKEDIGSFIQYTCLPEGQIEVGRDYTLFADQCQTTPAIYAHIVKSLEFGTSFACPQETFGCTYTPAKTTFALWSPVANQAEVVLKDPDTKSIRRVIPLERLEKGVWKVEVKGDLLHTPYTYRMKVNGQWHETADPYNPFTGTNTSLSFVDDPKLLKNFKRTSMRPMKEQTDAIIYETSVRDLTSQKQIGITSPRTFEGFVEENEITRKKLTGLSYLRTLGVTHIQLQPVLDFGSVDEQYPDLYYNWGYDPVHFRALEGSYASDPADPRARMEEFARMVQKLHEAGLRVTLDLVFNHVWKKEMFGLEQLVPDYYFLMDSNGNYSNGSFCGNDIDTRPEMSRQYLIDSAMMLIDLYDVDGFRFDLMGVLDTNLMNDIAQEARKRKPDFMIYGEGWDMPSYVPSELRASQNNQHKMPLVGQFSDRFREAIRGDNGQLERPGYSNGNLDLIGAARQVVCASAFEGRYDAPFKAVNYVECHDNHTMWDKNRFACFGQSKEERANRQILTNAIVLLSQGIPFLHSGQEFCRTKQNVGNTYNCSDNYNMIDYKRRNEYNRVVEQTRALIALRKAHPAFRLATNEAIFQNVSTETIEDKVLVYRVSDGKERLVVFFNPTNDTFYYDVHKTSRVLYQHPAVNEEWVQNVAVPPVGVVVVQLD